MLAENLLGHMHPLQVKYDNVYDFLNCLKITPCAGWLNSDLNTRLETTAWARKLSNVYKQIIDERVSYKNHDYIYSDFPTKEIFDRAML